jgi:hypothetical protein
MAIFNIHPTMWACIDNAFDSKKYHPDLLGFVATAVMLFDGRAGQQNVAVHPDLSHDVNKLITLMGRPGTENLVYSDIGVSTRAHGLLSSSARCRTTFVDNDDAFVKAYAKLIVIPAMARIFGRGSFSSPKHIHLFNYHTILWLRNYFGMGVPGDYDDHLVVRFVSDTSTRFDAPVVRQAWADYIAVRQNIPTMLTSVYELIVMKTFVKTGSAGQFALTVGAAGQADLMIKALKAKAVLGLYYAYNSFARAGRIRLTPNDVAKEPKLTVRIQRQQDIVECVNSYPVLIPLLGWHGSVEGDATLRGAMTVRGYEQYKARQKKNHDKVLSEATWRKTAEGSLEPVMFSSTAYLAGDAFALIQPHRSRTSNNAAPMSQLVLTASIMAATDATQTIKYVGRVPAYVRDAWAKEVIVEPAGLNAGDTVEKKIIGLFGAASARELVMKHLVNGTYTVGGAVHNKLYRTQGYPYFNPDNMTRESTNVLEWTLRHGPYVTAWSGLTAAGLMPSIGDAKHTFASALEKFVVDESVPFCARSVAAAALKGTKAKHEIAADFVLSQACIGDYTWLCQPSKRFVFEEEAFFTLEIPYATKTPFVVRVKGLGDKGYVVNLISYCATGINSSRLKEVK